MGQVSESHPILPAPVLAVIPVCDIRSGPTTDKETNKRNNTCLSLLEGSEPLLEARWQHKVTATRQLGQLLPQVGVLTQGQLLHPHPRPGQDGDRIHAKNKRKNKQKQNKHADSRVALLVLFDSLQRRPLESESFPSASLRLSSVGWWRWWG